MNRTILLVEPNPELSAKVKKFLEELGQMVQIATSRRDALGLIKSFDAGLVIASFTLPDGDGFVLAEDMRMLVGSHAPLLVIASPKQIQHYQNRMTAFPVQGWIKRPVEQMDLYNLVNEWLGQSVSSEPAQTKSPAAKVPTPTPGLGGAKPKPAAKPAATGPATQRPAFAPPPTGPRPTAGPRTGSGPATSGGGPKSGTTVRLGNLERTPVARLFYHLGKRKLTGVVGFLHPPTRIDVHLEEGQVVNVLSNYIPELSLGMMLAKKQAITASELAGIRHKWEREGGMFGQVLMQTGLVSENELNQTLVLQRVKKLVHLFSWNWRKGTYTFDEDVEKLAPLPGFRLPFEQIIMAGIRTYYDLDRVMMVLDKNGRMSSPVKLGAIDADKLASRSDLDGLRATIDALKRFGTLQTASKKCDLPQLTFLQFAYGLYVMDLLSFPNETKE